LIVWDDVTEIDSSLTDVSEAAQTMILDFVEATLRPCVFGGEESAIFKLARIYLAAHLGTGALPGAGEVAGAVVSESAGGLARSYAAASSVDELGRTGHGQNYLAIVRTRAAARLPRRY
jgi:hypothetical protein